MRRILRNLADSTACLITGRDPGSDAYRRCVDRSHRRMEAIRKDLRESEAPFTERLLAEQRLEIRYMKHLEQLQGRLPGEGVDTGDGHMAHAS